MNKLLVSVFVLCLENQYDLMIPINISVKDAIELIQKSIFELTEHSYQINYNACLYDEDGKVINQNNIIKFSGLRNGSKVMLV